MDDRRWTDDEAGRGIGDAASFAPGAEELVAAMRAPGWVAEEPDLHLLHHLLEACGSLPLELEATRVAGDATYEVDVRWSGGPDGQAALRAAVYALVGSVAESASYVRQRGDEFDVVTGFVAGDSTFAPHGHTLRIRVVA